MCETEPYIKIAVLDDTDTEDLTPGFFDYIPFRSSWSPQ